MSAITALVLGGFTFALAPIPPEAPPDPLARGYMGITLGEGIIVSEVMPNTPAERSGLRSGDVIVRVGTLTPADYEQVIAHVCSFRPGAVVEIEVKRGSERKTIKLKLACRPADLDRPNNYPTPLPIDD